MSVKPVEIEILMKDRLTSGLDKAGRKVDELKVKTSSATSEMERLDRQAQSVKNTASKIAGAFAVQQLVQNIIKVRGEFQQLEVSFNTMLGSEEKASELRIVFRLIQNIVHQLNQFHAVCFKRLIPLSVPVGMGNNMYGCFHHDLFPFVSLKIFGFLLSFCRYGILSSILVSNGVKHLLTPICLIYHIIEIR